MKTSRVRVLDPMVAERIAAGEVIERPASVVKELVENSLDAGATEVAIHLEDGGKSLIEVTDNGHGILPDDLPVCIRRHATSKLSSLEDLEKIATLGFRGEALPSVGAVADLEILSRAEGSESAYSLKIQSLTADAEPRAVTFGHFLSSPHGTRIQARGLFSQVPARLKFLKAQSAEVSQVREWVERLALTCPGTGFRLVSDGRAILTLRPQEESARVRAILSDLGDYPMITSVSKGAISVRAHWLQGMSSPQTRRIVQVVNGRAIRDRMLQQAILTAFRQALLPGQFPSIAVYIDVDPAMLDVNVHPTKTEVRFLDSRKVFSAVESLIASMIEKNGAPAVVPTTAGQPSNWDSRPLWPAFDSGAAAEKPSQTPFYFGQPATVSVPVPGTETETETETATGTAARCPLPADRYMGIAFNTYLFYDLGEELALIDQHAAHERIRYEILRTRALRAHSMKGAGSASQALLIPEAARFPQELRPTIEKRLAWLSTLGFEVEIFGEDTLLFRSVPTEWGTADLRVRLKNLTDRLVEIEDTDSALLDETLFEKLASEACHSAIRAGDRLEKIEALELVEQLFRCEHPWNCPHGRPTLVRVPKGKIEEWFLRRV